MKFLPTFQKIDLSRREKIMIFGASLVLCIVAADRLVWSPWIQYSKKLEKNISALSHTVAGQEMLLSRRPDVQAELKRYQEYIHPGRSPEMEMADFLREIEQLGSQSGVSLPEIKPLASNTSENFIEFGLEVRFEAELQDWMSFVHLVESSKSLFVIDKASIGRTDAGSSVLKGFMHIRKLVLNDKSASVLK